MGIVLAVVLSAAYGAGSQYFGARVPGWGPEVAALSAPWLAIAFIAGATQRLPRRAALLGLACTAAALIGYWLMTDSPVENAQYTLANTRAFFISNERVVLGGLVTGPLFGWLGWQWRRRRSLVGPLFLAAAFCLEPLARRFSFDPIRYARITIAEVAAGIVFATYIAVRRFKRGA